MYLPQPSKPTYAKALFVTALFVLPAAWIGHLAIKAPAVLWAIMTAIAWAAIAALVHSRVQNDWRTRGRLNLGRAEKRHAVGRNVRISRR